MKLNIEETSFRTTISTTAIVVLLVMFPNTAFAMGEEVAAAAAWLFFWLLGSVISFFIPMPRQSPLRYVAWAFRLSVPILFVVLVVDNKYFYKDRAAKEAAHEASARQADQACREQQPTTIKVTQEAKLPRPRSICVVEPKGMEQIFSGALAKCVFHRASACKNFGMEFFIESSGPLKACTGTHGHYLQWHFSAAQVQTKVITAPVSEYFVRFASSGDTVAGKYHVSLESRSTKSPIATTELILDSANRSCPQTPEEVVAKMFSQVFAN
ncbi:MAG: hypothetical protein V4858_25230 [Pseudomonadota bacterium]